MRHEFVDNMPDQLESDVLYISMEYGLAMHRCFCGCGQEVVTPFSPAEWSITYDGRSVSLNPSIGNWNFPCKSHYWIRNGKVAWAGRFSDEKIAEVQKKDRIDLQRVYETPKSDLVKEKHTGKSSAVEARSVQRQGWFSRLTRRLFGP